MRAIEIKRLILTDVEGSHVTILSARAEMHFAFVSKSKAILLGTVDDHLEDFVRQIRSKVSAFRKMVLRKMKGDRFII